MTLQVPALIVGAGISGLVCAHALRKSGVDALVVEASCRAGGAIHSQQRDGYLLKLETTMPKKRREGNEAKKA